MKKYIIVLGILFLFVVQLIAPISRSDTIYDCYMPQIGDADPVVDNQYCAVKFTIPSGIALLTHASIIASQLAQYGGSCSFTMHAGFSRVLTTNTDQWAIYKTYFHSSMLWNGFIIDGANIPCTPGETWYLIWCHTKDCSGRMEMMYSLVNPSCPILNSYFWNDGSFVELQNDYEIRIYGEAGANDAPQIIDDSGDLSLKAGEPITIWVKATDDVGVTSADLMVDGELLGSMSYDILDARWEYSYTAPDSGPDNLTYVATVYDDAMLSDSISRSINVDYTQHATLIDTIWQFILNNWFYIILAICILIIIGLVVSKRKPSST